MTLFAFCWVAVGYGIYQMLQVGTCASGGPYESRASARTGSRRCSSLCSAAISALFVAAGHLHHPRHAAGRRRTPDNAGVIVWFWTGLFWALAVGCFLAVWGPDAESRARAASWAG